MRVKLTAGLLRQNQKKIIFHQKIGLNFKDEYRECYIWGIGLYLAETWTLLKVYQTSGRF
jgi:hypothetical protein